MIRHLEMNFDAEFEFFPSKTGFLAHYIPHMILSQNNWYYNKHIQVELGAYVHSSQVNDPNNTNCPRTLDGIYFCLASNLQGGHQIMDLKTGQLITRPKLVKIPISYAVINSVEKMAEDQGFSSLKIYNNNNNKIPDVDLEVMYHQQEDYKHQIKKLKKTKMRDMEEKNSAECIYDEDIDQ